MHILGQFNWHNMKIDESIIIFSIIYKLPPSWTDYKKSLKHGKWKINLKGTNQSLHIEEKPKLNSLEEQSAMPFKINIVEEGKEFNHSTVEEGKEFNHSTYPRITKENQNKKTKKGACHHCRKLGHFKRDYQLLNKQNEGSNTNFVAIISHINVLEDDNA